MTLVVGDITRYGIVMVGDSAVTVMRNDEIADVREGAAKVQYSPAVNVGITMWGNGSVDGRSIDSWIAEFIDSSVAPGDDLEIIGKRLAEHLNTDLSRMGKSWNELRCGFHLAGYKNDLPRLWHIHTGSKNEPQYELQLHLDFPELKGLSDTDFRIFLNENEHGFPKYCQLRNGYFPHFAALFDKVDVSKRVRQNFSLHSFSVSSSFVRFDSSDVFLASRSTWSTATKTTRYRSWNSKSLSMAS